MTARKGIRQGVGAIAVLVLAAPVVAQTPAGTVIRNVATLSVEGDTLRSNEVALTVAAVVDVAVEAVVPRGTIVDAAEQAVAFTVRNTGNAPERYDLAAVADARAAGIEADHIELVPGEARVVAVTVAGAAARDTVAVSLTATASRGHGTPGSAAGDGIVGPGGASATATAILTRMPVSPGAAGPRLVKSDVVRAPDGSARVMPGATITYRLDAIFDAPVPAVAIDDRVPAGTVYVPGSLTLDGAVQSDAADVDAAQFDGTAVHVALGDVTAPGTRTVQFQVRIK